MQRSIFGMICAHHAACGIHTSARRIGAFALTELLMVMAVVGVLLAIALPSFTGMLNNQRVASLVTVFMSNLNLARSEAIKRNGRAVVCKSTDGLSCSATGGWEQGWILFHDDDNNAQVGPGETIVQRQGRMPVGPSLTGNAQVANYVSYTASGRPKLTSGAFQAGTFVLCGQSGAAAEVRLIILSGTGRPRAQTGSASDCS